MTLLRSYKSFWSLSEASAACVSTVVTRCSCVVTLDWKPAMSRNIDFVSSVRDVIMLSIPSSLRPTDDISYRIWSIVAPCEASAIAQDWLIGCSWDAGGGVLFCAELPRRVAVSLAYPGVCLMIRSMASPYYGHRGGGVQARRGLLSDRLCNQWADTPHGVRGGHYLGCHRLMHVLVRVSADVVMNVSRPWVTRQGEEGSGGGQCPEC
ncbi:hypothetical protein NDU88_005009 [Pleurodeles waltl]|uniref:Uncharacterized protein n=1 Tax=Pleurodeles waltl TaxID=8319 RepID=A0AAV7TU82_PLEWA|nr:hypothetical protein NDU88_005009 [Pleurodeles waltl]